MTTPSLHICTTYCTVKILASNMFSVAMEYYLALFLILWMASSTFGAQTIFSVMSYGAVGDGRTDDSQAFLRTWTAACQSRSRATPAVHIPPMRTFYLKPLTFRGPCRSPRVYVVMSGTVIAPEKSAWNSGQVEGWIKFYGVNGLVMKGKGVFDGRGSSWWPKTVCFDDKKNGVFCKGPTALIFHRCNGLRLDGFTKINGPGSQILILSTVDANLTNLRVIAPGDSPNTDGIDISGSRNVQIRDTFIGTGDDCIAITAGSSNIRISGITCGPGHGISIGSLGSGGFDIVEDVRVTNCTLKGTMTGVRIKTSQGGAGIARRISFEGIRLEAVDNPIQIEQFYCPLRVNCQNFTSNVAISDVTYRGITGTSVAENVVSLRCSQTGPGCRNIRMDQVYIRSSTPGKKVKAECFNAHGSATHTKPGVKCLR